MGDGIRIIREPSVYVVGRQTVDQTELDRFLADNGVAWESDSEVAAEVLTETAGRVCYMSFARPRPGGNAAYLHHIKESRHGSVLEQAAWNFLITGVSRSLTHELVRHRAGTAYSQLSQRYVDESTADFVVPPDLRDEIDAAEKRFRERWSSPSFDAEECDILLGKDARGWPLLTPAERAGVQWFAAVAVVRLSYRRLSDYLTQKSEPELARRYREDPALNADDPYQRASDLSLIAGNRTERRKYARQAARSVLPNCTETKLFLTANARSLRHMFEQRCSRFADPEIRNLFGCIWEVMAKEAPSLFGDYRRIELPDGTFEVETDYRKV